MTLNISEQFQIGLWPMCKALPGSSHKQRDHTKAPWTKDRTGCILIILLCLPISIRRPFSQKEGKKSGRPKKVHFFFLLCTSPLTWKWQLLSWKVHLSPAWHMDHYSVSLLSSSHCAAWIHTMISISILLYFISISIDQCFNRCDFFWILQTFFLSG